MPTFSVCGKFPGPATCVCDYGKVTGDPPGLAEYAGRFINFIRRREKPAPAGGCHLYKLWKETADEPLLI